MMTRPAVPGPEQAGPPAPPDRSPAGALCSRCGKVIPAGKGLPAGITGVAPHRHQEWDHEKCWNSEYGSL